MKRLEAIVRSSSINDVREALAGLGIDELTVTKVEGFDRRKGGQTVWCPTAYSTGRPAESKIGLTIPDSLADRAVTTLLQAAKLVELGTDDAFLSTIGDAITMRTIGQEETAVHE
jgi:nitrogen regulatory protein PII